MRAGGLATRAVLAAAVAGGLSACNTASLSKQELVVSFAPSATPAQRVSALNACAHATPAGVPEPITHDKYVSDRVGNVRFRIDRASDKQVAVLETCLGRQPGVQGFDIPDLTN